MATDNLDYFELFGVTIEDLRQIISKALSRGGDYADIYFEYSLSNELSLRDGQVNSLGSHIDYGVGVRVISGEKTGYAYSEKTTLPEILKAADTAASIADSPLINLSCSVEIKPLKSSDYYPVMQKWSDHSVEDRIPYLQTMNSMIFGADNKVIKVIERMSDSSTKILFFNSLGELYQEERPMASLVASCIMDKEGRVENASASRSFRMGFEFLNQELLDEISSKVVNDCNRLFSASRPRGGEMPVILGAGGAGILLHEAVGHAFEADFIRKNKSIFTGRLGEKICHDSINIVDDGTIPFSRGSINFDDEGIPGQKTYMVRDGFLTSFLHDRISAKHYNVSPTGNGRRESFRYMPIPRMRTTYMESGRAKESDMISAVKKGVYVDTFSNGQVQIGAGDFTFYVKSGYLIENGKLTQPIKDINIIGNGPKALADIVEIADNSAIENGTWTCGKEQYCPVSCGMPSVLISKLTVGGSSDE